jgi:hypothetical protein
MTQRRFPAETGPDNRVAYDQAPAKPNLDYANNPVTGEVVFDYRNFGGVAGDMHVDTENPQTGTFWSGTVSTFNTTPGTVNISTSLTGRGFGRLTGFSGFVTRTGLVGGTTTFEMYVDLDMENPGFGWSPGMFYYNDYAGTGRVGRDTSFPITLTGTISAVGYTQVRFAAYQPDPLANNLTSEQDGPRLDLQAYTGASTYGYPVNPVYFNSPSPVVELRGLEDSFATVSLSYFLGVYRLNDTNRRTWQKQR